jgi:AraC-like DNA-binding protein
MDKRFAGYRTLQFMESGAVEVTYGQRTYHLSGRWVWPHHPGPRIRLHGTDGGSWHHRYLAVSGSLVDAWADEGLWPLSPQPVAPDLDLGRCFDACLALFRDGHRMRHRRAVNQLEDLLLLLAESRGADEQAPWLARAQHLLANPEPFHADIPDIAASCAMPISTFRRRFAQATGMSPQAWALHARMAKARELLIATSTSVSRIATDLGYDDPAFFCRQFRRHAGQSPAAWRREFC